jgi:tetratricopeptide (TPR) repeat protein
MPAVADTMLLAAIEHQRAGRLAEAEALYRSVLAAEPGHGQALYLYGLLLLNSGRSHHAATALEQAAAVRPGHAATSVYLARALLADGRPAEALPVADRLLAAQPNHAEAAFLRGTALNALGEPALAIASFERSLLNDPGHAAASLNLGNAYADIDRWDDAERYCRKATRLAPDLAEAHASLGFILTSRGRLDAAVASCEAAIALRPDFTQAHWNQAVAALLAGDFDLGLRKYEWRKRHDRFRRDFVDLPGPQWDGGDPQGRTILVHAERARPWRHYPVRPLSAADRGPRWEGGAGMRAAADPVAGAVARRQRGAEEHTAASLRLLDRPDEPAPRVGHASGHHPVRRGLPASRPRAHCGVAGNVAGWHQGRPGLGGQSGALE